MEQLMYQSLLDYFDSLIGVNPIFEKLPNGLGGGMAYNDI